jgi:hypothetical protein
MKSACIGMLLLHDLGESFLPYLEHLGFKAGKKIFVIRASISTTYLQAETKREEKDLKASGAESFFVAAKKRPKAILAEMTA